MKRSADLAATFWAHVDKGAGPDACWPWTGAMTGPYGTVGFHEGPRKRTERAHRRAFELANGWLPKGKRGLVIRHACDNPKCCNPAHLSAGTHADNRADCIERGRAVKPPRAEGQNHPRAKLTAEMVRTARAWHAAGETTIADIAQAFGVHPATMQSAITFRTWRNA